jgi:hypothetical protein
MGMQYRDWAWTPLSLIMCKSLSLTMVVERYNDSSRYMKFVDCDPFVRGYSIAKEHTPLSVYLYVRTCH